MFTSGCPITLLLFHLLGPVLSSPVSIHTPAPPLALQISPPKPTPAVLSSLPSLTGPSAITHFISVIEESAKSVSCPIKLSPSSLVVRFADPVTVNCSVPKTGFSLLGWIVSLNAPTPTINSFLVWNVKRMTEWNIIPTCFALAEQGGQCHANLLLTVYKPPDTVSISIYNHTGPMFEGRQYTLQCTVQDVAPVGNLIVTFYRRQTSLVQIRSNKTTKTPVTETFTLKISPSKDDNGAQYWCEAKLQLGPEGPQDLPVMVSQNLTASVLFEPQLVCPAKLQVREGESLSCDMRGNPVPSVTWYRDGKVIDLPTHCSRKDAGNYTVHANGLKMKHFIVQVEVLDGSGTTNRCSRHLLLVVLLIQRIWL
ncbi:vascular cell adhesion protein 1 [Mastacembelus armatus]|uniref:Intercellular adhesion molecule 4 (Landsteiner-Wiener blood group) n=1 Tax=Mastacembelus armatus TaxID=205130 RepID=A0A3Q3L543_9TELE|nr:intercellular adhesion molecule 4 [Mastacembelus armatus]